MLLARKYPPLPKPLPLGSDSRRCERSEAIQFRIRNIVLDCFAKARNDGIYIAREQLLILRFTENHLDRARNFD